MLSTPVICRSKSDESILSSCKGKSPRSRRLAREMFIGPFRVDASDLPSREHNVSPTPFHENVGAERVSYPHSAKRKARPPGDFQKRHMFMEEQLQKALQELKINNAVWCQGRIGRYYQVLFSVASGDPCEEALRKLEERRIGVTLDSVVSVIPCALYYQGREESTCSSADDLPFSSQPQGNEKCGSPCPGSGVTVSAAGGGAAPGIAQGQGQPPCRTKPEQGVWERFVQSVRARLTVAQVVEGVRGNASFTFDFLLLLIVAALVAALGLLEDSTVILVASMLISPLMGPVMAATFGTTIRDRNLQRMGLVNEFAGLLLSLAIGFLSGLIASFLDRPWPTEEMLDRGRLRSLWVNVLIAVLSGAGISIALLRDNTGSLVGVAISASLLPPAVNAGLLWAMSLVYIMTGSTAEPESGFTAYYSKIPAVELAVMGGISLCLTFINIVFIFLSGILMLKIKEVSPHSQTHQHFWQHDVKIARDYNITLYGASAADMLRSAVQREHVEGGDGSPQRPSPVLDPMLQMPRFPIADLRSGMMCPLHQLTWSPSTFSPPPYSVIPDSLRELEGLYLTLRLQQKNTIRRYAINEKSSVSRLGRCCQCPPNNDQVRTPPFNDMFDPGAHDQDVSAFASRGENLRTDSRTLFCINNEKDGTAEPRPTRKRRFVVTKADDSELLLPTP